VKIAIIGAGLIGCERIQAIQNIQKIYPHIEICGVFDINNDTLNKVKLKYNVKVFSSLTDLLNTKPCWVFIATSNDAVKHIIQQAFSYNVNVLMEKPFGRSLQESDDILKLKPDSAKLYVGFNYRFFAGIERALFDAKKGKFGNLISVNMTLAHGNSPGMEKSWRFDPEKCADCATDLGVHLFDLMCQLSKDLPVIQYAKSWRGFWNTGIDEECHILATDSSGVIFNLQTSLNRWRNTFRLEIHGTEGYGIVENRGKNYGPQCYRTGKRWAWLSGKSQIDTEEIVIDKDPCLNSFTKECINILGLKDKYSEQILSLPCSGDDARQTMVLLEQYRRIKK
jgi:predicted dehydrogenase